MYEKEDEDSPEVVKDLKKQLREKDMMLTDIRLDALSSAHQLENLKETVNKMRVSFKSLLLVFIFFTHVIYKIILMYFKHL